MINDKMLLDALHQAGHTGVVEVDLQEGNDSTGEPAFFIRLGMDAAIPVAQLRWANVEPLHGWVKNWVREQAGDTNYPYVRFYSLSEVEAHATS
ncbi:MAG TPA: hypothetical protein VF627_03650 [Abditibacterium sp.]|jgi:hypothetical protein